MNQPPPPLDFTQFSPKPTQPPITTQGTTVEPSPAKPKKRGRQPRQPITVTLPDPLDPALMMPFVVASIGWFLAHGFVGKLYNADQFIAGSAAYAIAGHLMSTTLGKPKHFLWFYASLLSGATIGVVIIGIKAVI